MSENIINFGTYTQLYKDQWKKLMEPHDRRNMPLRNYSNGTVATTWMISYTAVRARNEAAANLLLLWAHLDNKSLWYGLLATASQKSAIAAEQTSAWLGEIASSEIEFIKAIGILRGYSLVEEMEDRTGYATHPVVHQWALHIQDDYQQTTLSWLATVLVGLAVPNSDAKKYWEMQMQLLPHAEWCEKSNEEASRHTFGDWKVNEQEAEKDGLLLLAFQSLAMLYDNQEKVNKTERMYMQALEGYKKALGAEVAATYIPFLNTVGNLGNLYAIQGKLKMAEIMYLLALEGCEKSAEEMMTLDTVGNLGRLYADQGKLDKAEEMYVRALKGKEKVVGVEHMSTLHTVNSLGSLYMAQGELAKAEEMYMRALEGYENAFGTEHRLTLNTINNLGFLCAEQGNLDKAEEMYMRALEGFKKAVGEGHALRLKTINNLGNLYATQGKLDKAEKVYTRALEGLRKSLDPAIISTFVPALIMTWGLAVVFDRQHRVNDARPLYNQVLSGYQQVLGDDHPKCQTLRDSLTLLAQQEDITIMDSGAHGEPSTSKGHWILKRLGLKQM